MYVRLCACTCVCDTSVLHGILLALPVTHHSSNQVRERLRSAIERNSLLEDELLLANQELKALQEELDRTQKVLRRRSTVRMSFTAVEEAAFSKEQVGRAGTSGWGTSGPM